MTRTFPSPTLMSRREFASVSLPAMLFLQTAPRMGNYATGIFGLTHTSFRNRFRQYGLSQGLGEEAEIPAEKFLDLVKSYGVDGCQIRCSQLTSMDPAYLYRIKKSCEEKNLFLEISLEPAHLENPEDFDNLAAFCQAAGAQWLKVGLSGTRFLTFASTSSWNEFAQRWKKAILQIEPILKKKRLRLGIENNLDWLGVELAGFLKSISSAQIGANIDMGNNLALLEDPVETAQLLAPYVMGAHLKDIALAQEEEGFWWREVPLGQGILPLPKLLETIRSSRSDVHFCLEMQTRDPLRVNYRSDAFWASFPSRDPDQVAKFESRYLANASATPPPRVSNMSSARAFASEDENLRRSVAYAKRTLGF